jgi:hypothetical protein
VLGDVMRRPDGGGGVAKAAPDPDGTSYVTDVWGNNNPPDSPAVVAASNSVAAKTAASSNPAIASTGSCEVVPLLTA